MGATPKMNWSAKGGARSSLPYEGEGVLIHPPHQGVCGRHGTEERRVTSGGLAGSPGGTGVSRPISESEVASDALSVDGRLCSTSILTTNFQAPISTLAVSLFARWSQENFFRYMREHFGLDRLIEYGTEPIPDAISVVNPAWRQLDSQIRSKAGQRHRLAAQFGALALSEDPTESQVQGFQQRKGHLQEEIQVLDSEIDNIKQLRKKTEHHIPVKSLPEEDRFTRLRTERKHLID